MSREEAMLPFHRRCCHGCGRGYPVAVGGSTTLAAVPSESATMVVGLLVAAVAVGLLCMVAGKPFCHRSCPETPSESDSAVAGVLKPPEPPPELLATSVVAGKVAVFLVDPPEFLAAARAVAAAGLKSQLHRVVIPVEAERTL
ncbi:uncharacterized protein LOC107483674 isoform X1 [Arachis duranensis]|uniref:Uncharacterized protein LOC107483674 isoform X1 n=1 Tax=Arachis duranensis TaxID=130453 RepID=A0A9C6TKX4_ARADU|nr:uncharacterized protein LOC107483674 isoform X1 [Arachis duranensis]